MCFSMWGSNDFEFDFKTLIQRLGGILTIWDNTKFTIHNVMILNHVVGVEGVTPLF